MAVESVNPTIYGFGPFEDFIKAFNDYTDSVYKAEVVRATDPDTDIKDPGIYVMPPLRCVRFWESPMFSGGDYGSQPVLKFMPISGLMPRDEEQDLYKKYFEIQVGAVIRWQEIHMKLVLELIGSGENLSIQQEVDFYRAINIVNYFLPIKVGDKKQLARPNIMKSPLSSSIAAPRTLAIENPASKILPVMELMEIGPAGGYDEASSSKHGGQLGGLPNERARLYQEYKIKLLIRMKEPDTI